MISNPIIYTVRLIIAAIFGGGGTFLGIYLGHVVKKATNSNLLGLMTCVLIIAGCLGFVALFELAGL